MTSSQRICPKCGSTLDSKSAPKGDNATLKFSMCPNCKEVFVPEKRTVESIQSMRVIYEFQKRRKKILVFRNVECVLLPLLLFCGYQAGWGRLVKPDTPEIYSLMIWVLIVLGVIILFVIYSGYRCPACNKWAGGYFIPTKWGPGTNWDPMRCPHCHVKLSDKW